MKKSRLNWTLIAAFIGVALTADAQAQPTAFTYQGQLADAGQPASGIYDLRFTIYDSDSGGSTLAGPVTNGPVTVSNGLFTVTLDVGGGVFTGDLRWLDIGVRTNGSTGGFTTLSPRQLITSTPYALRARSVDGTNITGMVPNSALPANLVRNDPGLVEMEADFIFRGTVEFENASGPPFVLTGSQDMVLGLNAEMLGNRTAGGFWQTEGNAGTTAGPQFLGTTDNQPLEFKVNGQQALRLEYPNSGTTPNLVGGYAGNSVGSGTQGAVIGGGGTNGAANSIGVQSDFSTIGGGKDNQIGTGASHSTIGGGSGNEVGNSAWYAMVAGGSGNAVAQGAAYASIGGGSGNRVGEDALYSTIAGGRGNDILRNAVNSFVGGGEDNVIFEHSANAVVVGGWRNMIGTNASASVINGGSENHLADNSGFAVIAGGKLNEMGMDCDYSTLGGGWRNRIAANTLYASIAGGVQNDIGTSAGGSSIGGGMYNQIGDISQCATIPGGLYNHVADNAWFAFAAGRRAKANHMGAFVWADTTDADFTSTTSNQFNIRATGGVRIDCGSSSGIALNLADRPLITRGHDPFTSGNYQGAGRWGVFMEPHTLVAGIPAIAGKSFRVSAYNADSTINQHLMTVDQAGTVTATAFNPTSDRNAKENFANVNPREVLEKVAALPISHWNFKHDPGTKHIGPMAQDFRAAFGLGTDDKHIATVDADGVALAAIQGLNRKVEVRSQKSEARLQQLETENTQLKREVGELKQLVQSLIRKLSN